MKPEGTKVLLNLEGYFTCSGSVETNKYHNDMRQTLTHLLWTFYWPCPPHLIGLRIYPLVPSQSPEI